MGAEDMLQEGTGSEIAAASDESVQPKNDNDVNESKKMTPKEEKIVEVDKKAIRTLKDVSQTIGGLVNNDYKLVTDNYVTDEVVYRRVMAISNLLNEINVAIDEMTALQRETEKK